MGIENLANPNKHVDKQTYHARLDLCKSCPERREAEGKFTKDSRCPFCKCYLNLKARLKDEKCDVGDW